MGSLPTRTMAATFLVAAIGLGGCATEDATPPSPSDGASSALDGGTAGPEQDATSAEEVTIETFIFSPDPLEVAQGTTVTFENLDGTTHTVTAGTRDEPADDFDESLDEGERVEIAFDEPGTYPYFCAIHSGEGMTGEIVVR